MKPDKAEIESIIPKENVFYNVSMRSLTTFKTGGEADCVVCPADQDQIIQIIKYSKENDIPYTVLGNASNVIVSDDGIEGIVIRIDNNYSKVTINGNLLTAQAGATLSKAAKKALGKSLGGLEFAAHIPGSVGGAVTMNAGAYGSEIKDILTEATVIDENDRVVTLTNDELRLGYRSSIIKEKGYVVLNATFALAPKDHDEIKARMLELKEQRIAKQPLNYPSAGSTFKRPEGNYAGALIEEAGLKGYTIGGAQVSPKHAGFIVNIGDATSDDIIKLIKHVQNEVYDKSGIMLEPEVKLIGRF